MATPSPYYLTQFKLLTETIKVGGSAVAECRFINRAGIYPAANGNYAAGVTDQSVGAGALVSITTAGIAVVEVGAAISAVDTPLMADTAGKVRPVTDAATQTTIGRALDTATGSGTEFVRVKLA